MALPIKEGRFAAASDDAIITRTDTDSDGRGALNPSVNVDYERDHTAAARDGAYLLEGRGAPQPLRHGGVYCVERADQEVVCALQACSCACVPSDQCMITVDDPLQLRHGSWSLGT